MNLPESVLSLTVTNECQAAAHDFQNDSKGLTKPADRRGLEGPEHVLHNQRMELFAQKCSNQEAGHRNDYQVSTRSTEVALDLDTKFGGAFTVQR